MPAAGASVGYCKAQPGPTGARVFIKLLRAGRMAFALRIFKPVAAGRGAFGGNKPVRHFPCPGRGGQKAV